MKNSSIRTSAAMPLFAMALASGAAFFASCTDAHVAHNVPDEHAPAPEAVLNYQFTKHLSGLGWDVTVIKTPESVVARRDDTGQMFDWYSLIDSDRMAWRERNGALSERLFARLQQKTNSDTLEVSVIFDPGVDWDEIEPRLKSRDAAVRQRARADLKKQIRSRADELVPTWQAAGLSVAYRGNLMPMVEGTISAGSLEKLAHMTNIAIIYDATPGIPVSDSAPNSQSDPDTDVVLNGGGLFGDGQAVGSIEDPYCGLYAAHEAFSFATITHESALQGCSTDGDCFECSNEPACAGGSCVSKHATEVGSAVMSTRAGQAWGAAKSAYFLYNHDFGGHSARCYQPGTDQAYEWLTDPTRNVETVVQAFSCDNTADDGVIEDYYARKLGILTVKSSGDTNHSDGVACPSTLNSLCVGGALAGGSAIDPIANWVNPPKTDRDEPDLTALSDQVDVAGTANATSWILNGGTSFSTPAVAAIAALLKEGCPATQDTSEVALRAILEAASWSRNPGGDYRFATPTWPNPVDQKDGAGGLLAANALAFCNPMQGGPKVFQFGGVINVATGGGPSPTGKNSGGLGKPPLSHTTPSPTDGLSYEKVVSLGKLAVGDRVRVVFTWDACPTTTYISQAAPAKVATDFDLFLLDETDSLWQKIWVAVRRRQRRRLRLQGPKRSHLLRMDSFQAQHDRLQRKRQREHVRRWRHLVALGLAGSTAGLLACAREVETEPSPSSEVGQRHGTEDFCHGNDPLDCVNDHAHKCRWLIDENAERVQHAMGCYSVTSLCTADVDCVEGTSCQTRTFPECPIDPISGAVCDARGSYQQSWCIAD